MNSRNSVHFNIFSNSWLKYLIFYILDNNAIIWLSGFYVFFIVLFIFYFLLAWFLIMSFLSPSRFFFWELYIINCRFIYFGLRMKLSCSREVFFFCQLATLQGKPQISLISLMIEMINLDFSPLDGGLFLVYPYLPDIALRGSYLSLSGLPRSPLLDISNFIFYALSSMTLWEFGTNSQHFSILPVSSGIINCC